MEPLFTKEQVRAWLRNNGLKDAKSIEDAFTDQIKDVLQEALEEEMNHELGYSKYDYKNKQTDNSRNGHSKKNVKSKHGNIELDIPRDTNGDFEPLIVPKHQRTLSGDLTDRIIGLYAKGMSDRDIHDQLEDIYKIDVSAEMISKITDRILPVAKDWQSRPLEEIYPIAYLDGIVFKIRQDGHIVKKTAYLVYGINIAGFREILGIWIGEAESAKFWMGVLTDIKNRGVKDVLIACVDGLKGFKEAIEAVFPMTEIQKCIVHQIRVSTRFVNYKDRKKFCADLKDIYTAPNEEAGMAALDRFDEIWGGRYSYAVKSWRDNWPEISTFFRYPEEIRRLIYTTNPIESFNRQIRKVTKTKGAFPTEESLFKLMYLVVMDSSRKWTMPVHNWGYILNQLRVFFGDRIDGYI